MMIKDLPGFLAGKLRVAYILSGCCCRKSRQLPRRECRRREKRIKGEGTIGG